MELESINAAGAAIPLETNRKEVPEGCLQGANTTIGIVVKKKM